MGRSRFAAAVVVSALAVALAACGDDLDEPSHGDPVEGFSTDNEPPIDEDEEDEFPRLTRDQLQRYYAAQIEWRDCAIGEGLALPEPPSLEEFVADGGKWWTGADVSDDDWNRLIVGDEDGEGRVGRSCGEPPGPHDFVVAREVLERLYAWQVRVVGCLGEQGFPLDTIAPPLEEFVESAGANWIPAREFHARYGFPDTPAWDRAAANCGNPDHDVWLQATDFEVDRAQLEAQYEENLGLTACLAEAGLTVPKPPALDAFVDHLGWNWAHADIWAAVYRDNDRDAVEALVDRIDELCPEFS